MPGLAAETCPQCNAPVPAAAGERVTCAFCGASLVRLAGGNQNVPGQDHWGAHLKTAIVYDQQGFGMEAFRLLIPAGWEFQGGVHWTMTAGMPAVAGFRAFNPNGLEAVEVFPNILFNWSNDPTARMMFPEGSQYYGSEVRRPMPALQMLQKLILPRYRGNIPGAQMVEAVPVPALANDLRGAAAPGQNGYGEIDAGRVRLKYRWNQHEIVEDIFGVVEISRATAPGAWGPVEMVYWLAEYLYSFRAEAGHYDRASIQFRNIMRSFRLNMDWFGNYMQFTQTMIQNNIRQIHQVGQLSRYISQTSDQIREIYSSAYWQRQAATDRISDQFSQTIRGVDEYFDPNRGYKVELPGGYDNAWTNALGEYIVSDMPSFDPNIGSSQNWEPIKRTN